MRERYERCPDYPPAMEPEGALYDGFLNNTDKIKVMAVRNADVQRLADFHPDFIDERLPELLLHYKGRNYPEALSESELVAYENYRTERLKQRLPKYIEEVNKITDDYIKEELLLYAQSL